MGSTNYTSRSASIVTNAIPPEGDEYNKQREEELYASITNKAMLVRRHAEMLRAGAPLDQIAEAVAAMAQVERDIARLSLELHNSTQGKNLNIFLLRFEQAIAANAERMQQIVKEKADADTVVLAGINNNLTLYNLTLEKVLVVSRENQQELALAKNERAALARQLNDLNDRFLTYEARLDRKRERIEVLETQVRELRGPDITPEQRQRYIDILMRMIAEWEAAHPDE
jgi:hypothetical protein